jgi:hypothetical protein
MSGTISSFTTWLPFIPVAGLVFQAGRQSEKLDDLFLKTHALEAEQKGTRELLYDIHGKVCTLEKEMKQLQDFLMVSKRS